MNTPVNEEAERIRLGIISRHPATVGLAPATLERLVALGGGSSVFVDADGHLDGEHLAQHLRDTRALIHDLFTKGQ